MLNIPYGTYSGHENGSRGIKDDDILRYARVFRVSPAWLAFGEGHPTAPTTAPIVGYVGAGAVVCPTNDSIAIDEVEAPPGVSARTVAVVVRGDSMLGIAEDGWVLYYDNVRRPPGPDLFGRLCIIETDNGQMLVKKLYPGSADGLYTLISSNAEPILDVVIVWATRVTFIRPN